MPFMYILECSDKTYYTGSSWDVLARLDQHQRGEGAEYTQRRLPVQLVYYEGYELIAEAFYREKKVQGWLHGRKKRLVREGWGVQVESAVELS